MKKIDVRFNDTMICHLRTMIGTMLLKYRCDPFIVTSSAFGIVGIVTGRGSFAITNTIHVLDYDAAVNRYETTKAEREKVTADIRQRGIRRREFERFIAELKKLPEAVLEFDEALWGSLVEYVTVSKDKAMMFTLIGGTEMKP